MSKERAKSSSTAPDAAQLLRDLAARERQLRDLTEQALGFLEELAESRRLNAEREQLVARLADLERSLADAKSRLRHAGGAAMTQAPATGKGARAKTRPALEVVFWGGSPLDAGFPTGGSAVAATWVGLPDSIAVDDAPRGVTVITHRDARTPAQRWNLGMASTTADAVLFVGPGVRLAGAPAMPQGLPANAALLCPRITRGERASVGAEQIDDVMRLRPRLVAADGEPFFRVQHADASAFLVRRAAFERIGTFDESLLGLAALLEYGLRARRANFDILGVPGVTATASDESGATDVQGTAVDRENLVVVAMHRPDQLGQALANTSLPWELSGAEMPGFLAQLFARLPTSDDLSQQRAVLERIASGLVQHALPAARTVALLQRTRVALLDRFAEAGTVANREDFVAAARRVEAERLTDPAVGFDALVREIAFCVDAAAATARQLEATRAEMRGIDSERHAQSDRAERADGARQLAERQLDQVQRWLLDTRSEIAELQKAAMCVASELEDHKRARAELEARIARATEIESELAAVRAQLRESERLVTESERLREEEVQRHWELERQHLVVKAQYLELEREHIDTDAEVRELREQIARVKEGIGLPTTATTEAFAERFAMVETHWKRLSAVLQTTGAGDADDLANRLAESERLVRDRERWIARLLQEVLQRRLLPRKLQEHEQALIDRVGRTS